MRIIELRDGKFLLREAPRPEPTPENSVLIRIKAVSFNPIDGQMRKGMGEIKLAKSSILGRDCSGVIEQIYPGTVSFKPGDRVCAYVGSLGSNGTHAEYVAVPQEIVALIPDDMSFEEATCLPLGCTALQALRRFQVKKQHSLFVTGAAGGVGTLLVQLLLLQQPNVLVATYGSPESKEHLKSLGVQEKSLINYHEPNVMERVLAANQGVAFDACFDLVGNQMSELCSMVLAPFGTYIDITAFSTAQARDTLFDKSAHMMCIANYTYALWRSSPQYVDQTPRYRTMLEELIFLIKSKKIIAPKFLRVGDFSAETVTAAVDNLDQNLSQGRKFVMTI